MTKPAARIAVPAPAVARSTDSAGPGPAPAIAGPAAADPRFRRLLADVQRGAHRHRSHPTAATRAAEAQAAAASPANEAVAVAAATRVDELRAAPTPAPRTDGFLALLRAAIARAMPQTQGDSEKFLAGGEPQHISAAVRGGVQRCQHDAAGPLTDTAAAPLAPGSPARAPTPIPDDPRPPSANLDLHDAVPPPRPAPAVSQQHVADAADARIRAADLTPDQLRKANDPRFSAVLAARRDVDARVAASPGRFRGAEQRTAAATISRAAADARVQLAAMAGVRERSSAAVKSRQQLARERDEQRRKAVTDHVEAIYATTRTRVELGLSTLEADVTAAFDTGLTAALADLQAWTAAELGRWKDERYAGLAGKARWVADLFRPVTPEARQILERGKTRFGAAMDVVAVRVAGLVDARLAAARSEIQQGQADIATYVAALPADLKAVGKAAEGALQARFKELEDGVDAKKQALAETLAGKYREAAERADAELEQIAAENDGAFKALSDRVGATLQIVAGFEARLTSILRKGRETVRRILADPIGFLANLVAAVKGGLRAFVSNLGAWLHKGLAAWLFASLAGAGVTMPADLSLASIFKLVMELLGITYAKIRARAVKLVGEPAVKSVETLADFVAVFVKGGAAALWTHLKDRLSELKTTVLDALVAWIRETIITRAVTKIVALCNPAGAFIQACIAIHDLVMFVVERAGQIMAFVEAVLNSVHNIATGAIDGAIQWIEQALGRTVPLVIGFFARLIGLGGISQKIVSIVKKVQSSVDKALDWLIEKLVASLKKLVKSHPDEKGKDETIDLPVAMTGVTHTLSFASDGELTLASAKAKLSAKLGKAINRAKAEDPPASDRITALEKLLTSALKAEEDLEKAAKKTQRKTILDPLVVQIVDYAVKFGVKDIEAILGYPGPKVGTYAKMTAAAAEEVMPDKTTREAHHVPPVALGKLLAEELRTAGQDLSGSGANLVEAADALDSGTANGAGKLPAVLVHRHTHRIGSNLARIHGSGLKPALLALLEKQMKHFTLDNLTTTDDNKELTVKPGKPAFRRQLQRIASRNPHNFESIKQALKTSARAIVGEFYDHVEAQAIGAVKLALDASVVDGPPEKRTDAVDKLKKDARPIWEKLLSPIWE